MRQLISVKDISIAKTSCWIYVRYIADVLKTRSNLAAKFKVQLLPLPKQVTRPLYGRVREVNDDLLGLKNS